MEASCSYVAVHDKYFYIHWFVYVGISTIKGYNLFLYFIGNTEIHSE